MSQRPSRQPQPFRFWLPYWSTPTPTPRPPAPGTQRTPSRVPASSPSRPQPQQRPPTAPTPPPSPASQPQPAADAAPPPRRTQKSPSPSASPSRKSHLLQPPDRRPKPPPSPSSPASKPPSPSRDPPAAVAVAAAAAAAEEKTSEPSATPGGSPEEHLTTGERSQPPSAVLPSESATKPSPAPNAFPPDATATAVAVAVAAAAAAAAAVEEKTQEPSHMHSATQAATPGGDPKTQLIVDERSQPQSPFESNTPVGKTPLAVSHPEAPTPELIPAIAVTEPAEAETPSKQTPANSTEPVIQKALTTQPNEVNEEKPKPKLETAQHQKLDENPEEIPPEKTKSHLELEHDDVGTSEHQRLDDEPKSIPEEKTKPESKPTQDTQMFQFTQLDDKHPEMTEDETRSRPETKLSETTTSDEGPNHDKAQPKPDDQEKRKIETGPSFTVAVAEPTRPHPDAGVLREQGKVNGEEQPLHKVSKVSISSSPWASPHDGEQGKFHKDIRDGLSKLVQKLSVGHSGRAAGDQGVSIITLAGKNKGATMVISNEGISLQGHKKQAKANAGATGDEQRPNDAPDGDSPIAASVNSNVQSINNSVLNESKCEERNAGVHLVVSTKPIDPVALKEKTEPAKTYKAASGTTTHQTLTYEPNIRRRCLRGLLLEPSDDDVEDPRKPRRHGCRFACDEKKKGKADNDEGTSKPNGNGRP